jgi:hypothetical protein
MLDKLTSGDFAPYLNQEFRIYYDENAFVSAILTSVKDSPTPPIKPGRRQGFSIIFRSGPEATVVLHQHIFKIEHPEMGSLEIFIVPVGIDEDGRYYQAVFN